MSRERAVAVLGKVEGEEAGCGSVRACPHPLGRPSPPQHPTCLPISSSSRGLVGLHPHAGPPAVVTLGAGCRELDLMSVEALREWGTRSIAGCGWRWEPADSGEGGPRGQFGGRAGKVGWESPGKRSEGACHCAVVLIEKKICMLNRRVALWPNLSEGIRWSDNH